MLGPLLEVQMSKKCTPLWRKAHFEVKMYKTHHARTTFGGSDVEKVQAVVVRSTFRRQNVQNTTCSRHFWKLRCRKSARRCVAKHISKSNVQNTPFSDHFWKFRCRKSARHCGAKHISKSKCTKHQGFGPLLEVQMWLRFASLHYTTLHYTTLHYTTLHYTTLHYTTLHYITLHYTPPQYTTLHHSTLHYTTFHYTSLHYTTLHSTTLQLQRQIQLQLHNYTPLH